MKHLPRLAALTAVLLVGVPVLGDEAEMKAAWTFDGSKPLLLRTKFGSYGYHPTQTVRPETGRLRLWLPARDGVGQTGLYSLFALAGDCEVIVTYELLKIQPPKAGYGSGLGLAFDVGENGEGGRGAIQRVDKPSEGSGFVVQTDPATGEKTEPVYHFLPNPDKAGRFGLRRVKKELIFLASNTPTGDMQELERLPFSDHTIRKVRLFADPGGSPTALDARIWRIEVRSEEMTGGVPEIQPDAPVRWWLWGGIAVVVGSFLCWDWRRRKQGGHTGSP
jgi:hypothetical protein